MFSLKNRRSKLSVNQKKITRKATMIMASRISENPLHGHMDQSPESNDDFEMMRD